MTKANILGKQGMRLILKGKKKAGRAKLLEALRLDGGLRGDGSQSLRAVSVRTTKHNP